MKTLKRLNSQEALDLYKRQVKLDFDQNELKPVEIISLLLDMGIYHCDVLWDEDRAVLAYAYLMESDGVLFLDYLAVLQRYRQMHYGTRVLKELFEKTVDPWIFEVEDPETACCLQEREKMEKRIRFYEYAGAWRTDIRVSAFGHPYILMTVRQDTGERQKLKDQYLTVYRMILGSRLEKHVRVFD